MFDPIPFVDDHYEEVFGNPDDPTEWLINPLTIKQMLDIRGTLDWSGKHQIGPGSRMAKTLKYGLSSAKNFLCVIRNGNGEIVQEIASMPGWFNWIPWCTRTSVANEIFKISLFSDEFEEALRSAVRTAYMRSEAEDPAYWSCSRCLEEDGLRAMRRCPLSDEDVQIRKEIDDEENPDLATDDLEQIWDQKPKKQGKLPLHMGKGGHEYDACPVGLATDKAWEWFKLIMDCEGTMSPTEWMAQPFLFSHAKDIISRERNEIEKEKRAKEEAKSKRAHKKSRNWRGKGRSARGTEP